MRFIEKLIFEYIVNSEDSVRASLGRIVRNISTEEAQNRELLSSLVKVNKDILEF